ncbi:uncharacterized protein LOC143961290 isoform X1 [Lithobates pipiens]
MKTNQVLLLLLIGTAVQKGTAVTPTFLQTITGIGTTLPTHTAKVDVLTYKPTSPETKATTAIKYETTNTPSTTPHTTIPATATAPAIKTSTIDISTSPETKHSTGISETTTSPSTTSTTTVPTTTTTTTITSIKTSSIGPCEHIPSYLKKFYTPVLSSGVLSCVSHCNPMSPNYFYCNWGTCDILPSIGPRCFCPGTDLYIYADDRCSGRISKLGLFIGVGVTLAVLIGVTITLAIYLYRRKHQTAERKEAFYESIE